MMTSSPAVADYLARLERAAQALPPAQREELLAGVREHLAELDAQGSDTSGEAAVREALDRFGTPEQLVAAEAEQAGLVPLAPRPVWGPLELSAVLLVLLGGFVVPVLAQVVGLVLAWLSPRWTRGTKLGATLVFAAPALLAVIAVPLAVAGAHAGRGPLGTALGGAALVAVVLVVVLAALGWLVSGLWLALAGRERR